MLDMLTPRQTEPFFKRGFVRVSELTGDSGDIVISGRGGTQDVVV